MSNEKHVRNSFYNGSRIDDIEANENRGPAGPQGLPGFSPRASVNQTENGARIIITDKNGTTYADITNGRNGVDGNNGSNGFSPIAEVEEVEDGAQLTVTDNRGTTTALIRNGERGERGERGESALTFSVGTVTEGEDVSVTNAGTNSDIVLDFVIPRGSDGAQGIQGPEGTDGAAATIQIGNVETLEDGSNAYVRNTGNENSAVFDFGIPKGEQGVAGTAGADGFSPTVEVTETTNGHTVTITDKDGLHSFEVTNGTDGQNGQNGENGQNGTDGTDGFSPTVTVSEIIDGHAVTITDKNGTHTFNVLNGQQGPAGPSNVTPIITEGTAIADINGTTIFAPGGGSDSDYIKVNYSTVTPEELKNYIDNNKLVYILYNSYYMPLTYYSRRRTGIPPNTYYYQTYTFTGFATNVNGVVEMEYTITYNESTTDVTRNYTSKYITSVINDNITDVIEDGATVSSLGKIHNKAFYSGFIDVTNVTSLVNLPELYVVTGTTSLGKSNDNSFELYRLGQYNVGNKYQICRMYCTNLERLASGNVNVTALKFKGEIVLDDKIIILTNTLTSSGWSGQVAKQILLSDIS